MFSHSRRALFHIEQVSRLALKHFANLRQRLEAHAFHFAGAQKREVRFGDADALGQKDKVGVIKAGAFGDLVGVTGDPLQNIRLLETPVFVMKGGVTYKGGE